MKTSQLRKIIKEEVQNILKESSSDKFVREL
jgi:ribosomal protein S3AE